MQPECQYDIPAIMSKLTVFFMIAILTGSPVIIWGEKCDQVCLWSPWYEWSDCNKQCAGGTRTRIRPACCKSGLTYDECMAECGTNRKDASQVEDCNTLCYNGGTYYSYSCTCDPANYGTCCDSNVYCGHPGSIDYGTVTGSNFNYGARVTYSCNTHYSLVDGSQSRTCGKSGCCTGTWSGTQPRCEFSNTCESNPCQNAASCENLVERYSCHCTYGWSGTHCEFDILHPINDDCPDDTSHLTNLVDTEVTWHEPTFTDYFGNEVTVTSNFPTNFATLSWGDHIVQYVGRKQNNGLMTECLFTESVDPHPCPSLAAPTDGTLVCNGWNTRYSQVCRYMCHHDKDAPVGWDLGQMFVCGASGKWFPTGNSPDCTESRIPNPGSDEENPEYFVSDCHATNQEIQAKYITSLLSERSPYWSLCTAFPDECKPENVVVSCGNVTT